jgi:hypothetical protein
MLGSDSTYPHKIELPYLRKLEQQAIGVPRPKTKQEQKTKAYLLTVTSANDSALQREQYQQQDYERG